MLAAQTLAGTDLDARIRAVLRDHARLGRDAATLADDDDLYRAGMRDRKSVV